MKAIPTSNATNAYDLLTDVIRVTASYNAHFASNTTTSFNYCITT